MTVGLEVSGGRLHASRPQRINAWKGVEGGWAHGVILLRCQSADLILFPQVCDAYWSGVACGSADLIG